VTDDRFELIHVLCFINRHNR